MGPNAQSFAVFQRLSDSVYASLEDPSKLSSTTALAHLSMAQTILNRWDSSFSADFNWSKHDNFLSRGKAIWLHFKTESWAENAEVAEFAISDDEAFDIQFAQMERLLGPSVISKPLPAVEGGSPSKSGSHKSPKSKASSGDCDTAAAGKPSIPGVSSARTNAKASQKDRGQSEQIPEPTLSPRVTRSSTAPVKQVMKKGGVREVKSLPKRAIIPIPSLDEIEEIFPVKEVSASTRPRPRPLKKVVANPSEEPSDHEISVSGSLGPHLPTLPSNGKWHLKDSRVAYSIPSGKPLVEFPKSGGRGYILAIQAPFSYVQVPRSSSTSIPMGFVYEKDHRDPKDRFSCDPGPDVNSGWSSVQNSAATLAPFKTRQAFKLNGSHMSTSCLDMDGAGVQRTNREDIHKVVARVVHFKTAKAKKAEESKEEEDDLSDEDEEEEEQEDLENEEEEEDESKSDEATTAIVLLGKRKAAAVVLDSGEEEDEYVSPPKKHCVSKATSSSTKSALARTTSSMLSGSLRKQSRVPSIALSNRSGKEVVWESVCPPKQCGHLFRKRSPSLEIVPETVPDDEDANSTPPKVDKGKGKGIASVSDNGISLEPLPKDKRVLNSPLPSFVTLSDLDMLSLARKSGEFTPKKTPLITIHNPFEQAEIPSTLHPPTPVVDHLVTLLTYGLGLDLPVPPMVPMAALIEMLRTVTHTRTTVQVDACNELDCRDNLWDLVIFSHDRHNFLVHSSNQLLQVCRDLCRLAEWQWSKELVAEEDMVQFRAISGSLGGPDPYALDRDPLMGRAFPTVDSGGKEDQIINEGPSAVVKDPFASIGKEWRANPPFSKALVASVVKTAKSMVLLGASSTLESTNSLLVPLALSMTQGSDLLSQMMTEGTRDVVMKDAEIGKLENLPVAPVGTHTTTGEHGKVLVEETSKGADGQQGVEENVVKVVNKTKQD
ncbi:hypothetical protein DXG01_005516 [Tephrocybe rancida]|nr:hypothetical protein DXG01_005516 [Tephrocybe rancida]